MARAILRYRRYFSHLRLPFNLLLAPIYLWGALLAGGTLGSIDFWLGFVALHVFLYGGTTALNSYYDRDEGPIGGMAEPPPVDDGLLSFSLVVQGLGLPLALLVGPPFAVVWLLLFCLALAYSHPLTRLKANPYASLVAVGFGQGGLGFAAGWLASQPHVPSLLAALPLAAVGATALLLTGLYIISQSYQSAADKRRGDLTLPVLLGPRNALFVACALLAVGIMPLWWLLLNTAGLFIAGATAAVLAFVGGDLLWWANTFREHDELTNFRRAMRLISISSVTLSAALVWALAV